MTLALLRSLTLSGRFSELALATVSINLLGLGSSLYSINVLNRYVAVGITTTLVTLTVGVLVALFFEWSLRRERQKVLDEIAERIENRTSERVLHAFNKAAYGPLVSVPIATRREALGAPAAAQQLATHSNLAALLDAPFVAFYVAAIALLHPPLGAIAALICLLVLLIGLLGERRGRKPAELHARANSRAQQMSQFLLAAGETLRGLPLIGAFSRRWADVHAEALGSRRRSFGLQGFLQTNIQSSGQILTVLIYAAGAVAAVTADITTGALIGASILAGRAFAVCSRAAYLADPLVRAGRAQEALREIERLPSAELGTAEPARFQGRVEVVDLRFCYPTQPVSLFEQLTLDLSPGSVMVVTGPNGSGKSTLMKLMTGVLQAERGMVRVDGIELRQIARQCWLRQAGYAPQDAVFFDGTLRENLLLDRSVDDAVLIDLCREMGLQEFLSTDPKGLDRMISSHETGLATGMRRRLVIVRALIDKPRFLFLDEPTEGLDAAGQAAVARLLNRLVNDGTTLVIASNEAFILRAADLVLDLSVKPVPAQKRNPPRTSAAGSEGGAPSGPAGSVAARPSLVAEAAPIARPVVPAGAANG
jgi:ATP-binding cassette subfamily C protein LapB